MPCQLEDVLARRTTPDVRPFGADVWNVKLVRAKADARRLR